MPLTDTFGVPWAHITTCKEGQTVKCDGGFDCIPEGEKRTIKSDSRFKDRFQSLYIYCAEGKHFLSGQVGEDGELIGLYPV